MATKPSQEIVQAEIVDPRIDKFLAGSLDLPSALDGKFTLMQWARSLILHEPYAEIDPDYLATQLLIQTLKSATIDEVFEQGNIRKLQDAIPNVPGASTGPVELFDLYVAKSDFSEGAPCYVIMSLRDLETGFDTKYTTGATQLQAQIMTLISLGVWPIRGKITRTERKDRGDRYLFWLFPPD